MWVYSVQMILQDLIEDMDLLDPRIYSGFRTIKGKIIYWYIIPNKNQPLYRCFARDASGIIISARYISKDTEIVLVRI